MELLEGGRGGLVNVSGVSPGPERRGSDRRTMAAAGTIQKHTAAVNACLDLSPAYSPQPALVKAQLQHG